jgi:hypothetical protein
VRGGADAKQSRGRLADPTEASAGKLAVDWRSSHCAARFLICLKFKIAGSPSGRLLSAAFLGQQRHRAQYGRAKFHRAVNCQGDELFEVKGHGSRPTLLAGPQASIRAPTPNSPDNSTWLLASYRSALSFYQKATLYEDLTPLEEVEILVLPSRPPSWRFIKMTPRDGTDPRYNGWRYYLVQP